MKTLIADSGATKTDWLFADGREITQVQTQGLHPATIEELMDLNELKMSVGNLEPDRIFFFGTGCGNPVSDERVRRFLQELFPGAVINIDSDLAGSAKAFFPHSKGAVIILGTGSICSFADHGKVVRKSASLGYAIGDEGSAADLGRKILRIYFRQEADAEVLEFIRQKLEQTDYSTMMNRIYTSKKPNRELASVAGTVLKEPYPAEFNAIIGESFQEFIDHQLRMLNLAPDDKIIATGRVAHIHQKTLLKRLQKTGYSNAEVRFPVIASLRENILSSEIIF